MTPDYPNVLDEASTDLASCQPHTAYRSPANRQCSVVLSDREFGAIPAEECCPKDSTHLVAFYDYRVGLAEGGIFSPGEHVGVRVCGEHEQVFRDAPGFLSSRPIEEAA